MSWPKTFEENQESSALAVKNHTSNTAKRSGRYANYIYHKVKSELKAEITQHYLSYAWWILEPCMMIAVFYIVFAKLFDRGGEGFVSFLLIGVTSWLWFAQSILKSAQTIRRATGLTLQVYIPKYVFPFSAVLFGVYKQFFVILILLGLLLVLESPSFNWFFYIVIFLVQLLLITAVSTFVAALVPFVPDMTKLLQPLMQMMMFLSGIFYHVSIIPAEYIKYFRYNPMAGLIMEYRKVILSLQQPDFVYLVKVAVASLLLLAIGLWILKKFDREYPRLTH